MLGHLQHELPAVGEDVLDLEARDLERVVDRGQDARLELDVDDGPDHLDDVSLSHARLPSVGPQGGRAGRSERRSAPAAT